MPDPLGGPLAALDDDPRTGWISGTSDAQPSLTISWRSPQIVDGLDLTWSDDLAASRPTQVQVEAESESIDAEIEPDGRVDLPRLTTSQITVRFIAPLPSYRVDSGADKYEQLPVGVSDLEVVGAGVPADVSLLDSRSKALFGCGDGPVVTIDGRRYETQISTTVDQLARLSAIPFTVCGSSTPTLSSGEHHIELLASQRWRPVWVSLAESDWIDVPDGTRDVAASSWSRSRRVLDLPDRSEEQILTIHENANDGWKAAIDGESLKAIVVDGWMQGYLLPPGPAGSVVLEYEPSQPYRLAIWCGLALLAVLLLAALMPGRSLSLPATPAVRLPGSARLGLTAAAVVLLAGAVGALIGVIAVAVARVTARLKCTAGSLAVGSATIAAVLLAIAGVLAAVVVARGGNSGLGWTIQLLSATALVVVMVVVAGGLDSTAHERGVDKSPQSPGHDDRHEGCQDKDVRD